MADSKIKFVGERHCVVTNPTVVLRGVYSDTTQLNSTSSGVELCRYKHPLRRSCSLYSQGWIYRQYFCIVYSLETRAVSVKILERNSKGF